jgi:hypothetical protein
MLRVLALSKSELNHLKLWISPCLFLFKHILQKIS